MKMSKCQFCGEISEELIEYQNKWCCKKCAPISKQNLFKDSQNYHKLTKPILTFQFEKKTR